MVENSELIDYLKNNPPAKQFTPYCLLSKDSDSLTVYFEGDADYSERLNDHITLYLSRETDEIVGCRIKGIESLLEDLPNFIHVNRNGVQLSAIFLAYRGGAEEEVSKAIKNLAKVAAERNMVLESTL